MNTNDLIMIARKGNTVRLSEPCDCGSRIMHNNGGNYHEIWEFTANDDDLLARFDDTCELKPTEPLLPISYSDAVKYIDRVINKWHCEVYS